MAKLKGLAVALVTVLALVSCDDATGPAAGQGTVSLSFMMTAGGAAPAPGLFGAGVLTLGPDANGNTLEISSAEIVLREIEFERAEELTGCDDDEGEVEGSDDDACEEFESAPQLVSLPLEAGVVMQEVFVADVPAGDYDEIEFDLHKLSDDLEDQQFLQDHPGFPEDISVRVEYTWTPAAGAPQSGTFTSDVNAEQEIEMPLTIEAGRTDPVGVTLSIDISSWFMDASGNFINPNDAQGSGGLESVVDDNIKTSFEGFEDDDHDGIPHDEDDDELDS